MRLVCLKKDSALSTLASGCGISEAELMEINGIERPGLLPAGLSLVLPDGRCLKKHSLELFVSYPVSIADFAQGSAAQTETPASLLMLALNNTDENGFLSPELAHRLLIDESAAESFLSSLVSVLENGSWAGLLLSLEYLFPFDRQSYTDFVRKVGAAVHSSGCWLALSLPASAILRPESRSGAAYDVQALAKLCDRVVLTAGDIWTGRNFESCLERLVQLMPVGRVLAGVKAQAILRRGASETALDAAAAHNLALSTKSRIYREQSFAPAEFDYRDAAGQVCHVSYTDALWFHGLFDRLHSFGFAGLSCAGIDSLSPWGKVIFDAKFSPENLG